MTTQSASTIEKVVVHPLVLRNIVDNHNRIAKDSGKRVVGVLLGSRSSRGIVGVTNSYAGSPHLPIVVGVLCVLVRCICMTAI